MERAFAETLNLHLRLPRLVMGEVYLLPVIEYDDEAMRENRVAWKSRSVPVEKFITTFLGISGREGDLQISLYKYDRSALILADFRTNPPNVYETLKDLQDDGHVSSDFTGDFSLLAPSSFTSKLVDSHRARHQ